MNGAIIFVVCVMARVIMDVIDVQEGRVQCRLFSFSCAKIAVHIIDMKELEVWEPMATSYPVEGEKPKMYTISSFLYFCRTQVTKGGGMVIELVIAGYILTFLLGVILGKVLKPKPHCSGKLIVDETGETERWSFMLDDPLDEVREKSVIFLEVDRRA